MEELQTADLNDKALDLCDIIAGFAALLQKENEALRAFDVETVSSLFEQKNKIVAAYRSMSAFFIKNQAHLTQIAEETRQHLKEASLQLDTLLKENELLLKTRMETSKNVMNTIINIAKVTNNRNATSYGSHGTYSPLDNNKNALALNRTL